MEDRNAIIIIIIIGSKCLSWKYSTGQKNGVNAFGYNSSKVNWFGWNLEHWVHCWGLALADFGRGPSSSDSLRGSRNFFCLVNDARLRPFPVRKILRHFNTTTSIGKAVKSFGTEFWKFYHEGSFKKRKKLLTKFPGLATSGRHNSAMITDRPKLTIKIALYGMSSKSFPGMYAAYKNVLPKLSATSDVRYWVNHVRRCSCLASDMEEKQTLLYHSTFLTIEEFDQLLSLVKAVVSGSSRFRLPTSRVEACIGASLVAVSRSWTVGECNAISLRAIAVG